MSFSREYALFGPKSGLWDDWISMGGMELQLLVGGDQSENAYTFYRATLSVDVNEHVHSIEDESLYVLTGEPTMTINGKEYHLTPGSFIFMPRGVPHSIAANGQTWSGLSVAAPGGVLEKSIEDMAALSPEEFTLEGVARVQAKYGIRNMKPDGTWIGDEEGWFGKSE